MSAQFQIDLEKYSLEKFKKSLQARDLIPSRLSLKDDLESRMQILENAGITNLKELTDALKTKEKIKHFSRETSLPIEYLVLLNREAKSYLAKPIRLNKFPGIPKNYLENLEKADIKNSKHLFVASQDKQEIENLAKEADIPQEVLNELIGLSDLSRIYGVGPAFARIIYDVGVKSVSDFVKYTGADFIRIYEEKTGKKADFGAGEIEFSLELARELIAG
ncbi:MAG: DUF4332 domain-containing protein [Chloroflexi bacterium]|nr:DUF4332 domain-containing protein [Chloroflexota bacterium]